MELEKLLKVLSVLGMTLIFVLFIVYHDDIDNKLRTWRQNRRDKKKGRDVEIIVNRARSRH
ncbi:hypothetical protein DEEACLCL_00117 [Salmonella phage CRW-SP2]|nr:hypothetical protein DEEACLCL_00117 [Salmonella phage CRW-SP2]